ncbi:hypothetical protein J5X90_22975 [Pseudoalteromonas viridis]|uniref:Uncharacterized protein n=1 Tax=Pseudoalteromonas viridis TaxID=339617 RepID=A0ABX7VBB3_9GAMM|nr:hypothetical protein J5X90_22975 [Pseudoalteromonas viridis]
MVFQKDHHQGQRNRKVCRKCGIERRCELKWAITSQTAAAAQRATYLLPRR